MAFDRLRSLGEYLEASRGSSQFAEILDQQCEMMCKEIRSLEKLDVQEATVFLAVISQQTAWTPAHRDTMTSVVHQKVQDTLAATGGLARSRASSQNYTMIPLYLTSSDWGDLLSVRHSIVHKSRVVGERLRSLGLKHPNEATYGMATALVLLREQERFGDPLKLRSSYLHVKDQVKTFLKNHPPPPRDVLLPELPACPAGLPDDLRAGYPEGQGPASIPQGVTLQHLQELTNTICFRSNNAKLQIGKAPGMMLNVMPVNSLTYQHHMGMNVDMQHQMAMQQQMAVHQQMMSASGRFFLFFHSSFINSA